MCCRLQRGVHPAGALGPDDRGRGVEDNDAGQRGRGHRVRGGLQPQAGPAPQQVLSRRQFVVSMFRLENCSNAWLHC